MKDATLLAQLEALLFMSGEPLNTKTLAAVTGATEAVLARGLQELGRRYDADRDSGLALVIHDASARIVTKPVLAPLVEALTKSTIQESLSKAALEVLAIIAYRAPITRAEVENIRGVNCNFTLRNLLVRGLIERAGNPDDARGYIYRPSFRLLETLGLRSMADLPEYETLARDERMHSVASSHSEERNKEA